MKRKLHFLLFSLALIVSEAGFSQGTNLYAADQYESNLYVYDTTGGGLPTLISTIALSGGSSGSIDGVYGMSLNPVTQEMYCLYDPGSGATARRIGMMDTVTGVITDIGGPGNLQDIAFYGSELFGTTGNYVGYQFVRIDQTTGVYTTEYSHPYGGYSAAIWWNPYTETDFYKLSYGSGSFSSIDTVTMTETLIPTTGYSNASQSGAMKNDSIAFVCESAGWGNTFVELNVNTGAFTPLGTLPGGGHAMAFNQSPFYVIVSGPNVFCENENETILASSETGTGFQWNLDGSPISGATDSTHVPTESGMYSVVVDGDETNPVMITILEAPEASFDAVPNPIDLGINPTGEVDFTNTSTGGHEYHWDFGTGFTSALENPSFTFSTVGDYDVEFIVIDTVNGCSDTAMATISTINSTGITELSADFSVYPVPTKDVVFVTMTNSSTSYSIELRDLHGRLVRVNEVNPSSTKVTFDLTEMESGVYFLRVFNEQEQGNFKLIKN